MTDLNSSVLSAESKELFNRSVALIEKVLVDNNMMDDTQKIVISTEPVEVEVEGDQQQPPTDNSSSDGNNSNTSSGQTEADDKDLDEGLTDAQKKLDPKIKKAIKSRKSSTKEADGEIPEDKKPPMNPDVKHTATVNKDGSVTITKESALYDVEHWLLGTLENTEVWESGDDTSEVLINMEAFEDVPEEVNSLVKECYYDHYDRDRTMWVAIAPGAGYLEGTDIEYMPGEIVGACGIGYEDKPEGDEKYGRYYSLPCLPVEVARAMNKVDRLKTARAMEHFHNYLRVENNVVAKPLAEDALMDKEANERKVRSAFQQLVTLSDRETMQSNAEILKTLSGSVPELIGAIEESDAEEVQVVSSFKRWEVTADLIAKESWDDNDIQEANRTVSFLSRLSKNDTPQALTAALLWGQERDGVWNVIEAARLLHDKMTSGIQEFTEKDLEVLASVKGYYLGEE